MPRLHYHPKATACLILALLGGGCATADRYHAAFRAKKDCPYHNVRSSDAAKRADALALANELEADQPAVAKSPPKRADKSAVERAEFEGSETSDHETELTSSEARSQHDAEKPPSSADAALISEVAAELPGEPGYPIDLTTALLLTTGQNSQVAFAHERISEAQAQADRAAAMWLPSLRAGVNYNKHEGRLQDVAGNIIDTSRGALYTGLGANAVGAASPGVPGIVANFHLTDAIFQPKATQNAVSARSWEAEAATNNELHQTALSYLELLRAEQELAISRATHGQVKKLVELTKAYAETGQGLQADFQRSRTELTQRANQIQRAEEQVRVVTARLAERLRIDPFVKLQLHESVVVPIEMVPELTPHDLVTIGLTSRPEISGSRSLVAEATERLKREQYAPLIPSVLLGVSYGGFGGGLGSNVSNFGDRLDGDAVAYWELRNFGAGERAARCEANSRLEQARIKEIMALDRVAREVIEAHAQAESRRRQIATAEEGVQAATSSYEYNLERIQNAQGLPLEVLQSIQALANARREYLRAVTDFNVAQFTLHRSIGWPDAEALSPQQGG